MDCSLPLKKLPPDFDVLIPFIRFEKELERELLLSQREVLFASPRYFIVSPLTAKPVWAQEWLPACRIVDFTTRSEALKALKSQPHLGVFLETGAHAPLAGNLRRDLRELKLRRIEFTVPAKFDFQYFVWGFLDAHRLLICDRPYSRFPLGWHEFQEDKTTPPNRAYLKLWELLCLGHIFLKPSDVVVDAGASPGGWSWVLSQFVKTVYAIDKAPLAPAVAARPNIRAAAGDAFTVDPADYADCDWFFSDIICTPERLLTLVRAWHDRRTAAGPGRKPLNFACTIKFKGGCDFDILKEFAKYEGSRIIHLYQNKNEVTWIQQGKQ